MADVIPLKFGKTGTSVTSLDEFATGDTIPSAYLPTSATGDAFYHFHQATAASSWAINHGLNKFPSVTVVDSAGNRGFCGVQYVDANNLTLSFSGAFAGDAYLN